MEMFDIEVISRLGSDNIFLKVQKLLDWDKISKLLKATRKEIGREGYDPVQLFCAILLGQWHSLSDRELEHALRVRLDFIYFCDFSAYDKVPDHTTLCRFRNMLVQRKLHSKLLAEVNCQLTRQGLKVENAEHAVIDASLIESVARPEVTLEKIAEDRKEEETPEEPITKRLSADEDARWLTKGKRHYFGYKAFARTDGEGYIDHCLMRPANEGESPHFSDMLAGIKNCRILSDKGYSSQGNRDILKERGLKSGVMYKAYKNKPLSYWQKQFNKMISKNRYVVEQSFGTLKRKFRFTRASYMGLDKVEGQFSLKAICMNLLKGANKMLIPVPG